jgi:photosystem II stability/assembly factor-like uncharacterized protein
MRIQVRRTLLVAITIFAIAAMCAPISALGQMPTGAAGWRWQRGTPQGNGLSAAHFVNSTRGWVVGGYGTIIRTTNGGKSWQHQSSGTVGSLIDVDFVDSSHGWACSDDGTVLRTTNSGVTWTPYAVPGPTLSIYAVDFASTMTGYCGNSAGTVFKSINGGQSWTTLAAPISGGVQLIAFKTTKIGWVCDDEGNIVKTTDGGLTWHAKSWPHYIPSGGDDYEFVASMRWFSTSTGWLASSDGRLLKTTNGGTTWKLKKDFNHAIYSMDWANSSDGWVSRPSHFSYTRNGGKTWHTVLKTGASPYAIRHFTSQKVMAFGDYGTTYKTTNHGQSWSRVGVGKGEQFTDVDFTSSSHGWAVGNRGTTTVLMHTSNGGASWTSQKTRSGWLTCVAGASNNVAWAAGSDSDTGLIMKTTDAGHTWTTQSISTNRTISAIDAIDANHAWAIEDPATIWYTSNGGTTWVQAATPNPGFNYLYGIDYVTPTFGIAVGTDGMIWRTFNGGAGWTSIGPNSGPSLYSVKFISDTEGWIAGGDGVIRHTITSGNSWTPQASNVDLDLRSISFLDGARGVAVGSKDGNGYILTTTNGGGAWTTTLSQTAGLEGVDYPASGKMWAVGDSTIISTNIVP